MADTKAETLSDEQLESLRDAGWRQGTLLRATEDLLSNCPGLAVGDLLIVCTQSCTLLNRSLVKFPNVELIVVARLSDGKYRVNDDAARGKVVHELHLPLEGSANHAISIDLNKRHFPPRSLLLKCVPADERISSQSAAALAAWIARSYTRVALPDALVSRLRGVLAQIERVLKKKRASGERYYERVRDIYAKWSPDSELADGESYEFVLYVLCDDVSVEAELDVLLPNTEVGPATEIADVEMSCEVVVRSEVALTYLDDFKRFSDWDYLTSLGEIALAIDRDAPNL